MAARTKSPAPSASSEAALHRQLAAEGFAPRRWSNAPHAAYPSHAHPYQKVLVVVSGSIAFTVLEERARTVTLRPGQRLELPAGTVHRARVGPAGVVCLEAQKPAGSREP